MANKKETLLQKAKNIRKESSKGSIECSKEDIELAVAWAKGEISYTQVALVYGKSKGGNGSYGGQVYSKLARSLKAYISSKK